MPERPKAEGSRKRGPQPRGPFHHKRQTLTTRITRDTRRGLDMAAHANDRSLSQEVELRLERSLAQDDIADAVISRIFGDGETYNLMKVLGSLAAEMSTKAGQSWLKDPTVFNNTVAAFGKVLSYFSPHQSKGKKPLRLVGAHTEMAAALQSIIDNLNSTHAEQDESALELVKAMLDRE